MTEPAEIMTLQMQVIARMKMKLTKMVHIFGENSPYSSESGMSGLVKERNVLSGGSGTDEVQTL